MNFIKNFVSSGFKQLSRSVIQNNFSSNTNAKPIQKSLLLEAFNGFEKTYTTLSPIAQSYGSKAAFNRQMGIGGGQVQVFHKLADEYRALSRMGPDPTNAKPIQKKALLLEAFNGIEKNDTTLSPIAQAYMNKINFDFKAAVNRQKGLGRGEVQVFDNLADEFQAVAVVGMGPDPREEKNDKNDFQIREFIRNAAGAGAIALQERGMDEIHVEHMLDGEAAAEGAVLGVWTGQKPRGNEDQLTDSKVFMYGKEDEETHSAMWKRGFEKAKCQNFARYLTGNVMTPTTFGRHCAEELSPCGVSVEIHDYNWIKAKGMARFAKIARGSCEPPVFIKLKYSGGDQAAPILMMGNCCTYNSGDICRTTRKSSLSHHMSINTDMGGLAAIAGLFKALSKFKTPISVEALLAIWDKNVIKSGCVGEGRDERNHYLIHEHSVITDELHNYSTYLKNPRQSITVCTLLDERKTNKGDIHIFSTHQEAFNLLRRSGEETGDIVCAVSLDDDETPDYGNGNTGEDFTRAPFQTVVCPTPILFVDVNGNTTSNNVLPRSYMKPGQPTGRAVRTFFQYFEKLTDGKK